MVVLPLSGAPDGWELLRGAASSALAARRGLGASASAGSPGPVLLFAAAGDPDALAAVKVLTKLLKADLTRYEVHPVSGYGHLRDKFSVLARGPDAVEPRAILCVNCGAAVDLERVLGLKGEDGKDLGETDVRVFVMDCHRPYHLRNIKSRRVVLFDDVNEFKHEELPLDVDWEDEWGNVDEDDSSDESEEDQDSDEDSDESERSEDEEEEHPSSPESGDDASKSQEDDPTKSSPKRKRRRRTHRVRDDLDDIEQDDVRFDDEGSLPASDKDDDEEVPPKGKKARSPGLARKRKKGNRKTRRRSHRGRYADDPEAEERERLKEYYSNASVAMSSACLSHSIAAVMRRSNIDTLWMAILGVTSQYITSSISQELYDDARSYFQQQIEDLSPDGQGGEAGTSRVLNVGYTSTCNGTQIQRIGPSVELRLDLLRHWSLHDSLLYSSYTAARLAAWRQIGKRRLLEMLATLGIPLKESQQQWCYMKEKNKDALERHLQTAIRRFDLGEALQYDSFVRSMPGHRGDISAADFAHAIAALLEFDNSMERNRHGRASGTLVDRFWRAYDALDSRLSVLVETGLEMAVIVQRLTADIAGDVIERRKFVPSGPFRYVFLRDQQCKEFLSHPLLLRRLALFLTNALLRQGAKDKPFIILAPDVVRSVWIAVAATTPGQRNDFGHRFQKAAERNGSQVTYDGFDSSVCEIQDGQEIEFVRFLHDVMR